MREETAKPLKMKSGFVELSVYLACLSFLLNFYAVAVTLHQFLNHFLIFLLISCALFGVILRFRIPRPKNASVRNIFGNDWGAYRCISDDKNVEVEYEMKIVGHRACGLDAPENSLSAVQKIYNEGFTAVEFDVILTADDVPIIFHDNTLCRMTNLTKPVSEVTYEEISNLDISVKHPFGKNYEGEKIPTLNEYIEFCLHHEIRMFIDLKDDQRNLAQIINDLFKQYPKLYDLAVVSSFNPVLIYRIRAKDPKITCSLAWRPYFYSHQDYSDVLGPTFPRSQNFFCLLYLRVLNYIHEWVLWRFGYYLLGLSALLLHKDMITKDIIKYWGKKGIRVIAWSVNLPTEKSYFEKILEITYLTDTVINN